MSRKPPATAIAHGEAWKYFLNDGPPGGWWHDENMYQAWEWFLKGWLAKAKQADRMRNAR